MKDSELKVDKQSLKKTPSALDTIVIERDDATKKLEQLSDFISKPSFSVINEKHQTLLRRQESIMHDLVAVLNARISIS